MTFNVKNLLLLIAPEYSIMIFVFIAIFLSLTKQFDLIYFLLIPIIVYLLALFGFNALNQVFESELDSNIKSYRPIPSKKISKKTAVLVSCILFVFSFFIAFFSQLLFPWVVFFLLTFLYHHPKIFLRKYVFSVPLFGMLFYSIVPFWFVSTFFNFQINYLVLILFSLIIGSISFLKDIEDLKVAKEFGIKSIPMIFGINTTIKISIFLLSLIIIVFGLILLTNNLLFIFPTLLSLILIFFIGKIFVNSNKNFISSKILSRFMMLVVVIQLIFGFSFFII